MQQTMENTMEKNREAMEQQGMQVPPGSNAPTGFIPPESMKRYQQQQQKQQQTSGSSPAGGNK